METSRPSFDAVAGIAISITCSSKLSAWLLPRPNSSFFRKWRKMATFSLSCVEPRLERDRFIVEMAADNHADISSQKGRRFLGNGFFHRFVDGKRKSQRGGKQESM